MNHVFINSGDFTAYSSDFMSYLLFRRWRWRQHWMDTLFQRSPLRARLTSHSLKDLFCLCKLNSLKIWIHKSLHTFLLSFIMLLTLKKTHHHPQTKPLTSPLSLSDSPLSFGRLKALLGVNRLTFFYYLGLTTGSPGNWRDIHTLKCLSCPGSCHKTKPDVNMPKLLHSKHQIRLYS